MRKLIRRINRFLFLDNNRFLSQLKVFESLNKSDGLTKSEKEAIVWYFKKMLLKDISRFIQINEAIEILNNTEKYEKEKTSEEVEN